MSNREWAVTVRGHGAYLAERLLDGQPAELVKGSPEYDDGDIVIPVANRDEAEALSNAISLVSSYAVPMWFYGAWKVSREVTPTPWSEQLPQDVGP